MRSSILLLAASAVSASVLPSLSALPKVVDKVLDKIIPNLPSSAFPKFHTVPLEDARAGLDLLKGFKGLELNSTHSQPEPEPQLMMATAATSSAASCAAAPNMRYEWRQYSTSDKLAYIAAIKCLMNKPPSGNFPPATSRYEDLARLHQQYMPNIHGNAKFLVWHRYFVWTFEQVLREECGFNRAFPWWDETLDAGRFGSSDLFSNPNYFGRLPGAVNGNPVCITSGAFARLTCNIGPGNSNTPHCLSRAGDASLTSQCNSNYVNLCNSRTSYADMHSCSEGGPHAYGHNGIGGAMADVSASPSDPIFYMHHSFIDHSFRLWQNNNPAVRTTTINGVDGAGNPLTLDTIIYMGGIRPNVRVRDILNTLGGVMIGGVPFCYRYTY